MTKVIQIRSRNGKAGETVVDDDNFSFLNQFKWYFHPKGYVIAGIDDKSITGQWGQTTIAMHRVIMGCKSGDGQIVDHINHNKLDNRRCNLRIVSPGESLRNRRVFSNSQSGFKGVRQVTNGNWIAFVNLGGFDTPEAAALAYDKVIRKVFPGHAVNFPRPGETAARAKIEI